MSKEMSNKKHPLLYDKAWLTQKYVEEKLSSRAISELIGCGTTSVENGLKRFKISARSSGESNMRFPLLRDKAWLEKMYLEKRLSSIKIGKTLGCDGSCVTRALECLNMSRRTTVGSRCMFVCEEDKALLKSLYSDKGMGTQEIGERFGCSKATIYSALKRLSIPIRDPVERPHVHVSEEDRLEIESLYVDERKTAQEVGECLGCSTTSVFNILKRCSIHIRGIVESQIKLFEKADIALLKSMYIKEEKSAQEIGDTFRCSITCVLNALRRHNTPIRPLSEANKRESAFQELNDKEWLNHKYCVEMLSTPLIAEMIGCNAGTVGRYLVKHGIPCRNVSEAVAYARKNRTHRTGRTNIEVKLGVIFDKYCDCIEYTGDGSFWITTPETNLNPDFIVRDKKIVIEANGDFWHSPLLNKNIRKSAVVTYREKYLKAAGWRLVVFWGTDINRKDAEAFVVSVLRKVGII